MCANILEKSRCNFFEQPILEHRLIGENIHEILRDHESANAEKNMNWKFVCINMLDKQQVTFDELK